MIKSFKSTISRSVLVVLVTLAGAAFAQQGNTVQNRADTPPMSMAPHALAGNSLVDLPAMKAALGFNRYEAAAGDLSLCQEDNNCLIAATRIKSWICGEKACGGNNNSKDPSACFSKIVPDMSLNKREQLNPLFCAFIKSSSIETRRALLVQIPDHNSYSTNYENALVEYRAYLWALKGDAISCENYIKSFVGPYGSQWNMDWYRTLSGCRIFAHETTREQEERDFFTWFDVLKGSKKCADIINREMQNACSAPGAASPLLSVYNAK